MTTSITGKINLKTIARKTVIFREKRSFIFDAELMYFSLHLIAKTMFSN